MGKLNVSIQFIYRLNEKVANVTFSRPINEVF